LIFFPLSSCTEFQRQSVITREVYIEKVPKQVTKQVTKKEEYPKPETETLGRAEQLLKQGDYDGSLKENQRVLSISGKNPPGDKALFNMGLIYAHWENPKRDYDKSLLFFKKLLTDYPQSPLTGEAKIWVGVLENWAGVLQENEKLKKVIEKLKEVDIEVEEKKREKAR
jgi:tetratricopeptide (TPR) repeat protein